MRISIPVLVATVAFSAVVISQIPSAAIVSAATPTNMDEKVLAKAEGAATQADASGDVLAAAAAIVAAFGRDDPEAYFALFDPDATFIFYTTPDRLNNRAAYQQEWAKWKKESGFRVRSCSSSDQRVQLFGDVAVFSHSVRTDISTSQGESTLYERETIVFHRSSGRWVAVHEHLSPRPEPPTPAKP